MVKNSRFRIPETKSQRNQKLKRQKIIAAVGNSINTIFKFFMIQKSCELEINFSCFINLKTCL